VEDIAIRGVASVVVAAIERGESFGGCKPERLMSAASSHMHVPIHTMFLPCRLKPYARANSYHVSSVQTEAVCQLRHHVSLSCKVKLY
jgi:hypothetical protein